MSQFQVVRDGAFRHDQELKAAITAIAAASFIDDVDRLDREIDRCDTLYLLRDEGGDVLCFLMVAWETLDIDGRQEPALYTGLTAARPDQKSTGNAMKLYLFFVSDAQRWEDLHRRKLIVWGTMASPIVFFAARRLFANTQPSVDGSYTEEAGESLGPSDDGSGLASAQGPTRSSSPDLPAVSVSWRRSDAGSPRCARRCSSSCSTGSGSTKPRGIDCFTSPRSRRASPRSPDDPRIDRSQ